MKVFLETMTRYVENYKRLFASVCVYLDLGMQFSEETPKVVEADVRIAFNILIVNPDLL